MYASYPGSTCTRPPLFPHPKLPTLPNVQLHLISLLAQTTQQIARDLCHVACTGPIPGFDPVGSLLKSSWVKERRAKRQQARWRPAALEIAQGQAPRGSTRERSGKAPAGQHQAREQAMAAQQARAKQPSAAGQQPQVGRHCVLRCKRRACLGLLGGHVSQ